MTRTLAELCALAEKLEAENRELREAFERDNARLWRSIDRLRTWHPCPACFQRSTPGCDACDDTGVAGVERVHVGERVLA